MSDDKRIILCARTRDMFHHPSNPPSATFHTSRDTQLVLSITQFKCSVLGKYRRTSLHGLVRIDPVCVSQDVVRSLLCCIKKLAIVFVKSNEPLPEM